MFLLRLINSSHGLMDWKDKIRMIIARCFLPFMLAYGIISVPSTGFAQKRRPEFDNYLVPVYSGKQHVPNDYSVAAGVWRDQFGKIVNEPRINFSGRYFVALHSCGAECRYFSIIDLSEGVSLGILDMFATTDPPKRTLEGDSYITDLITQGNSGLIIAQYRVKLDREGREECREKSFVFDGKRIMGITGTEVGCREFAIHVER